MASSIPMSAAALADYLTACRTQPAQLAVVGHPAPDTDAVISSVAEAWRRWLTAGIRAVPVVQAAALPAETAWLLSSLAPLVLTQRDAAGKTLLADPTLPLVFTDHHVQPALQPRVVAIVDHHLPAAGTDFPGIDADIRPVGAATTLVALHCREQGLTPDKAVARILLGAILMDTEGLSAAKTRPDDARAAAWLTPLAKEDPDALFRQLQARLLAETDPEILYRRDQRWFPGLSFAILKLRADAPLDMADLRRRLTADREASGCRVCLAKVARYTSDGLHDETYLAAGEPDDVRAVLTAIQAASPTARRQDDRVIIPPDGMYLSRKRLTPLLLPLLR